MATNEFERVMKLAVIIFAKPGATKESATVSGDDSLETVLQGELPAVQFQYSDELDDNRVVCAIYQHALPQNYTSVEKLQEFYHHISSTPNIRDFEQKNNVELVLQSKELIERHRQPGLAVFDMDSTLIQQEVIDELAKAVGKYDEVSTITARAMRGELDFEGSLKERVRLLQGVRTSYFDLLKKDVIRFTPGARELTTCLGRMGWKLAVVSGGFTPLANWVKAELGLHFAAANQLETADEEGHPTNASQIMTGELLPGAPIIHAARKRELLLKLASEYQVPIERTIAVGDGSNDLLMMKAAGLGVAFDAKPKVQEEAPVRLNSGNLLDVMYILGFKRVEIDSLLNP